MSYRTFQDPSGKRWEVWHASPESGERRRAQRRLLALPIQGTDRRTTPDRRRKPSRTRSPVPPGFEAGWLCFESEDGEKRRLIPVPDGWDDSDDRNLWNLMRAARVVKKAAH
jgi:hypothetical protein